MSGGEPLSEELEAKIANAAKVIENALYSEIPDVLRAFAREIRLQDCEADGKRIADVQNALIQRECGLLQETISEQADLLLASQETSRQLAEALEQAIRMLRWCGASIGPDVLQQTLTAYRGSEAGRGKP